MLFRFFFSLTKLPGEGWEGFDHFFQYWILEKYFKKEFLLQNIYYFRPKPSQPSPDSFTFFLLFSFLSLLLLLLKISKRGKEKKEMLDRHYRKEGEKVKLPGRVGSDAVKTELSE